MLLSLCLPTSPLALPCFFFFHSYPHPRHLHSFPTRRSSDLPDGNIVPMLAAEVPSQQNGQVAKDGIDRKSTRLNSSHTVISYAVFCLKKKKKKKMEKHTEGVETNVVHAS